MTLRLNGDSSGFTEIKAPNAAGDNSITLPTSNGSANQLLKNGSTAGELQYTSDIYVDSNQRLLLGTSTLAGTGNGVMLQAISSDGLDTRTISVGQDGADQKLYFGTLNSGTNYVTWGGYYDNGWTSDDAGNTLCMGAINFSSNTTQSKIDFRTSATPNTSPSTKLSILGDGTLQLGSQSTGIDFSGIQTNASGMTSETLDSYEEGTWVPASGANFGSFSNAVGHYVRIGRFVHCTFQFNASSASSSNAGQVLGLPFIPDAHNPGSGIQSTNVVYENDAQFLIWAEENNTPQAYITTDKPIHGTTNTSGVFIRGSFHFQTAT